MAKRKTERKQAAQQTTGLHSASVHWRKKKPFRILCSVDIVNCNIPCPHKLLILTELWKSGAIP